MATTVAPNELLEIREKVIAGERLDLDDGVALLESHDLLALGELADLARRRRGGTDDVYFVNNLYLNHTTICRVKCKFCAFARTSKQDGAYLWDIDELVAHAQLVRERSGLHRDPHGRRRAPRPRPLVLRRPHARPARSGCRTCS